MSHRCARDSIGVARMSLREAPEGIGGPPMPSLTDVGAAEAGPAHGGRALLTGGDQLRLSGVASPQVGGLVAPPVLAGLWEQVDRVVVLELMG